MSKDTEKSKELNREELGDVAGGKLNTEKTVRKPITGMPPYLGGEYGPRLPYDMPPVPPRSVYGVPPQRFPRFPSKPKPEEETETPDLMPQEPIHFAPKD